MDDGFTLIETLISLVIFSVSLIAFSSLGISIKQANVVSRNKAVALNATQQKMEELKLARYRKLGAGIFSENLNSKFIKDGRREWEIAMDQPQPRLAVVTVRTRWINFGREHKVELSTIIGE